MPAITAMQGGIFYSRALIIEGFRAGQGLHGFTSRDIRNMVFSITVITRLGHKAGHTHGVLGFGAQDPEDKQHGDITTMVFSGIKEGSELECIKAIKPISRRLRIDSETIAAHECMQNYGSLMSPRVGGSPFAAGSRCVCAETG